MIENSRVTNQSDWVIAAIAMCYYEYDTPKIIEVPYNYSNNISNQEFALC